MVNPGAGAPAGNVVSVMAALFEGSGRINPFSPSLSTPPGNGEYGVFVVTFKARSMICEVEEKKKRSADTVIEPTIKLCRPLVNIWVDETEKSVENSSGKKRGTSSVTSPLLVTSLAGIADVIRYLPPESLRPFSVIRGHI
jgi:hypothetical protein